MHARTRNQNLIQNTWSANRTRLRHRRGAAAAARHGNAIVTAQTRGAGRRGRSGRVRGERARRAVARGSLGELSGSARARARGRRQVVRVAIVAGSALFHSRVDAPIQAEKSGRRQHARKQGGQTESCMRNRSTCTSAVHFQTKHSTAQVQTAGKCPIQRDVRIAPDQVQISVGGRGYDDTHPGMAMQSRQFPVGQLR